MSTDNQAYRYFAFISYSSKDKAIAAKLQRQIENYRLPAVTRSELEAQRGIKYPKRLSPIFRDMTDLPAGVLGKSILRELEDSKYLIVICSPNSAKSEWVNQEVENFILMGRYERIIPYIVDGTPNSGNSATEAFPPILRSTPEFLSYDKMTPEKNAERQEKLRGLLTEHNGGLKGASIQTEGPYIAKLKTIARMLDVAPDTLIQRDAARRKAHFLKMTGLVCLLILIGLLGWDRHYRVHVSYYADYVERWGVPEGIYPLTREQMQKRYEHYRIFKKAGRVIRMEHDNSAGVPIPPYWSVYRDRQMILEYSYHKGHLEKVDSLDRRGNIVLTYKYSGDNLQMVDLKTVTNEGVEVTAALSNVTSLNKFIQETDEVQSRVSRMELERDENGFVTQKRFQCGEGYNTYVSDDKGVGGFQYKLDDKGRIIETTYLDVTGTPCPIQKGVLKCTYQYNDQGNLCEIKYFDREGNPAYCELGWQWCKIAFDKNGNPSQEAFFGKDGKPCLHIGLGATGWNIVYDEHGFNRETHYFDKEGKSCKNNLGIASLIGKFDKQGNIIEYTFFDVLGNSCKLLGSNIWRCKYNEYAQVIEEAHFNENKQPCLRIDEGYSIERTTYDERGNVTQRAYFGVDGKPCLCNDGYATIKKVHDERGNVTEKTYLGMDGKPCLNADGIAIERKSYDENGNMSEEAFFGVDDKPCLCFLGVHKIKSKCNDMGNVTELTCFGIDDKPCINDMLKVCTYKRQYDSRGNRIEETYFNAEGKPCKSTQKVAKFTAKYNDRNQQIEEAYFDEEGNPCLSFQGMASLTTKYDDWGLRIEDHYFGVDGKPCLNMLGIAGMFMKYDTRGLPIEESYIDLDGKICLSNEGCATLYKQYDEFGNLIGITGLDLEGNELTGPLIVIRQVLPDSQADKLGLQKGDFILMYDNKTFETPDEFIEYRDAETTLGSRQMVVLRGEELLEFKVTPGKLGAELGIRLIPEKTIQKALNDLEK